MATNNCDETSISDRIPTGGHQKPDTHSNKRSRIPPPKDPPAAGSLETWNVSLFDIPQDSSGWESLLVPPTTSQAETPLSSALYYPSSERIPQGISQQYAMSPLYSPLSQWAPPSDIPESDLANENVVSFPDFCLPTSVALPEPYLQWPDLSKPLHEYQLKWSCFFEQCRGLTFDRESERREHEFKQHSSFKCLAPGCRMDFLNKWGLYNHEVAEHQLHVGRKQLLCPVEGCRSSSGTGFKFTWDAVRHIRRVHGTTDVPIDTDGVKYQPEPESTTNSDPNKSPASPDAATKDDQHKEEFPISFHFRPREPRYTAFDQESKARQRKVTRKTQTHRFPLSFHSRPRNSDTHPSTKKARHDNE